MLTDDKNGVLSSVLLQTLKSELSGVRLREGEVVEAELLRKTPRAIFFDIGKFGTGILYGAELLNAREMTKKLNPGERIPARIENMEGEGGYVELSLAEAGKQRLWQQVQELQDAGEILKVKIGGANAGGLMTDLAGLKAFLPVSQLSAEHYPKGTEGDPQKNLEALKKFVGQELNVKIIAVNPRANKLIISERETVGTNIKELLAAYQVGQTVGGVVSGIADFGIFVRFVDNPQIEGLVHISEIDYRLIENPKEIVNLDEAIQVKIIDIREGRVFLSMKALKTDPWEKIAERYHAGQEIIGAVYKFNPFGAVIDVEGGVQGLIHVSEFGSIEEMKKTLILKESHSFVIDSLKPEERRMILKLKR
ncbi:MAG: 30S ribosomal protein S1 [Candidatus Liptonbacteria bacterium]|nr:30S ribosomal protein S1 [Candidatus Liptonbacteria bacterium]